MRFLSKKKKEKEKEKKKRIDTQIAPILLWEGIRK